LFRMATLYRQQLRYAMPATEGNGNDLTFWQEWFFKPPISTTWDRGNDPFTSPYATVETLRKDIHWGSRDWSLRKVTTDWWFGASGTYGIPTDRWRPMTPGGLSGWGSWTVRSACISVGALLPNLRWANDDTTLQTKAENWFFGRTTGSTDMHILYTRKPYRR